MKLLITGGCGFIGSNLARAAQDQGLDVVVFDSLYRLGSSENLAWLRSRGPITFVHGDIRNSDDVTRVVRGVRPDSIFHLAGQVAMTTSLDSPRVDFEVNAIGTHNLLEAARSHAKHAAILYSSSNKVYGDLQQYTYTETASRYVCEDMPSGFDERTPLEFTTPYGCSKGAADQLMLDYARSFDLNTVVFRHSSMFGGRQFATYDQGWIGWFCERALEQKHNPSAPEFTISGSGKQVRDVLHADDVVDLYFAANAKIQAIRGHAFNIGGGMANSLSLLELFEMLEKKLKVKLSYQRLPPRKSDQRVFVADIAKAAGFIGWTPRTATAEGLARMVSWLTEERTRVG